MANTFCKIEISRKNGKKLPMRNMCDQYDDHNTRSLIQNSYSESCIFCSDELCTKLEFEAESDTLMFLGKSKSF